MARREGLWAGSADAKLPGRDNLSKAAGARAGKPRAGDGHEGGLARACAAGAPWRDCSTWATGGSKGQACSRAFELWQGPSSGTVRGSCADARSPVSQHKYQTRP